MHKPRETDPILGELFLAGEYVLAGTYRQIDSHREVCLVKADYLPASLDGRVACYEHLPSLGKPSEHQAPGIPMQKAPVKGHESS